MLTDRQQEIINAAMDIIVGQGTQKLTIRNVAMAIGVTEPAVYRHFESKHALMVSLLETLQQSILPVFLEAKGNTGTLDRLFTDLFHSLFSRIEANPAFALFVFTEEAFHADEELRPLLSRMLTEMISLMEGLMQKAQAANKCRTDLSARHIAMTLLGTIRLTVTHWHLQGGETPLETQAAPLAASMATLFSSV